RMMFLVLWSALISNLCFALSPWGFSPRSWCLWWVLVFVRLVLVVFGVVVEGRPVWGPRRNFVWIFGPPLIFFSSNSEPKFRKKFEKFREYIDFAISTASGFVISPISQIAAECTPAAQATCRCSATRSPKEPNSSE